MKQQKAMLVALIVICLTVIVTALVTRKDGDAANLLI